MADIETTLKTRTNQDNVFPNIRSANIPDGGVTTAKIANEAIDHNKLAEYAVWNGNIRNRTIEANKIAQYAITDNELHGSCVTTNKIADQAVTYEKLGMSSVHDENIAEDSVGIRELLIREESLYELASEFGQTVDFINAVALLARHPLAKITKTYTTGGNDYRVPVEIRVKEGLQLDFVYYDYSVSAYATYTYHLNDMVTSVLESFYVMCVGGIITGYL